MQGEPFFPDRDEAVRMQRERLDALRERVSARMAYSRIREWFVASGLAQRTAARAADWVAAAADRPDLEQLIAAGMARAGAMDGIGSAVLDAIETVLFDERKLSEVAIPVAGWLRSVVSGDDFLWAVHGRISKMSGTAGKLAHITGAVDFHELTHKAADAILAELHRVESGDALAIRPALVSLLGTMRGWKASTPESSARVASLIAALFRSIAPSIAGKIRSADPSSIPPWVDDLFFAAWSRASAAVVGAIEAAMLPKAAEGGGDFEGLVAALKSVIAEEKPAAEAMPDSGSMRDPGESNAS